VYGDRMPPSWDGSFEKTKDIRPDDFFFAKNTIFQYLLDFL
jgi:hypothetical protein